VFSPADTIVAIATPPGRGAIGIVRLSGPVAASIACALTGRASVEPRLATFAHVHDHDGWPLDEVIVTFFPGPRSYTGDDLVEISAHGSPTILEQIVRAALSGGARLANPGEFTLRAYLNGRIDLVQAEAVADLIDAVTPAQARLAFDQLEGTLTGRLRALDARLLDAIAPLEASLDFPEEGYHFSDPNGTSAELVSLAGDLDVLLADAARGRLIREGLTVAIAGRPNAGKSSLFNRLIGAARAIVTDVPGTTRDLVTERVDIGGVPMTLVDTAGLRESSDDAIEEEGMTRARQAAAASDVVLVVLDRSEPLSDIDRSLLSETRNRARVIVASKSDLPAAWRSEDAGALSVSSLTDEGIDALRAALTQTIAPSPGRDRPAIANVRHASLLLRAKEAIARAAIAAAEGRPEELVLADLHEARACFDDVAGARAPDEVLRTIFERFCIGK
jgi:tRNA modification GTPase